MGDLNVAFAAENNKYKTYDSHSEYGHRHKTKSFSYKS